MPNLLLLNKFGFLHDKKTNNIYIEKDNEFGKEPKIINVISKTPEVVDFFTDTKDRILTLKLGNELQKVPYKDLFSPATWEQLFLEERVVATLNKKHIGHLVYILINSRKEKWKKQLDFIGIENEKLILAGLTVDKDLNRKENQFYSESNILDIEIPENLLSLEEKELLKRILPNFRGLEGVAWFTACFYNHDRIKFPILSSFATTGKGKSFGMEILGNITFSNAKVPFRTLTLAQIKRHLDITNLMPLVIDDYKRGESNKLELEPVLRALYEGDKNYQATVSKEMIQFNFRRPVAITGENPLTNISSNNRMIELELKSMEQGELNQLLEKDCLLLKKLGLEILKKRLTLTDDKVKEKHEYFLKKMREEYGQLETENRILENYSVIKLGLNTLDEILGSDWEKKYNFERKMKGGIKTFGDQLAEIILTAIDLKRLNIKEFQKSEIGKEYLVFHTKEFFEIIKGMEKEKFITIENMDFNDFKMKLNSCQNVETKKSVKIKGTNNTGFKYTPNSVFWEEIEAKGSY
ncbi:MAG: hypothetical protein ACRCZ9_06210 [Fusobacteriaceae bacterium]